MGVQFIFSQFVILSSREKSSESIIKLAISARLFRFIKKSGREIRASSKFIVAFSTTIYDNRDRSRSITSSFCKQDGKQAVDEIAQFEMHLFYSASGANHRECN